MLESFGSSVTYVRLSMLHLVLAVQICELNMSKEGVVAVDWKVESLARAAEEGIWKGKFR